MTANHIATDIHSLVATGFVAIRYPDQEGVFLRRDTLVESMPYLGKVCDNEFIFATCVATTEVSPDGMVRVMILETDYVEEPVLADSEDGQGVLRDSIAGTAEMKLIDALKKA